MTDVAHCIAWYTPESLEQLRAVAEHKIGTHEEMSRLTEDYIAECAKRGIACEKVPIDIPGLVNWCRQNGYRVDHTGIAIYSGIVMVAREQSAGHA